MSQGVSERVLEVVKRRVAESLVLDPASISPESRLVDDLGADSLDFVDIIFLLDRDLDIRVRESEFNFLARLDFSSPQVMNGAHLAEPVVTRLATFLPRLRDVKDPTQVTPRELFSTLTIEAIALICERAMATRP